MALTFDIQGLKTQLTVGAYRTLTDGGLERVAQSALDEAQIVINSKFDLAGMTADWTNQTVILAGLCFAVYKLYARIENEIIAQDKMDCSNGLLSSIIGGYAYFDPKNVDLSAGNIQSIFLVEEGTSTWHGFGCFDD
jgi:hypothetical protein